jgi:predicted DNA-binding transcriptional regulator AlpA
MVTANNTLDALLNEHDVARITGMSLATVRRWRLFGQGPRYIKVGSAVRYRPEDVKAYLDSRPSGGAVIFRNPNIDCQENCLSDRKKGPTKRSLKDP